MTKRKFEIPPKGKLDYPVMMLENIRALKDLGGLATKHDIEKQIIKNTNLSEEEQSYLQKTKVGTRTRLDFALTIARSCLSYADALENPRRSFWKLTEKGFKTPKLEELDAIYTEYAAERRAKKSKAKGKKENQQDDSANKDVNPPVEADVNDGGGNLEDDWKFILLEALKNISPAAFERLCKRLLTEADFFDVEVRGQVGDGGIDGIGFLRSSLVSFKVYFQCKRWKGSVGPDEIRDFRGALEGRAGKGLFITTGTFTSGAIEESTRDSGLTIDLIDGKLLCDLLKEHKLGVQMVEHTVVDPKWFDRFNIEPQKTKPKPKKPTKKETQK